MATAVVATPPTEKDAVLGKPAASDQRRSAPATYLYRPPKPAVPLYDVTYAVESSANTATSELHSPAARPGMMPDETVLVCAVVGYGDGNKLETPMLAAVEVETVAERLPPAPKKTERMDVEPVSDTGVDGTPPTMPYGSVLTPLEVPM